MELSLDTTQLLKGSVVAGHKDARRQQKQPTHQERLFKKSCREFSRKRRRKATRGLASSGSQWRLDLC